MLGLYFYRTAFGSATAGLQDFGRGSALAVRWDERHGRALVLTRGSTSDAAASSQTLKAWLVDFVADASPRKP